MNLQYPRPDALFNLTSSFSQMGQHLDPIITCRLFEAYIYLTKIKEVSRAKLSAVLQYNNHQDALPISGIYGKDSVQ